MGCLHIPFLFLPRSREANYSRWMKYGPLACVWYYPQAKNVFHVFKILFKKIEKKKGRKKGKEGGGVEGGAEGDIKGGSEGGRRMIQQRLYRAHRQAWKLTIWPFPESLPFPGSTFSF